MSHVDPLGDPWRKPAPRVCGVCREDVDLWAWDQPSDEPGEWVWDEIGEYTHPRFAYVCSWQCLARAHW